MSTVLVSLRDPSRANVVARILERAAYPVEHVPSPEAALHAAQADDVEAVILEPFVAEAWTAERLARTLRTSRVDLVIVGLTLDPNASQAVALLDAGADQVLSWGCLAVELAPWLRSLRKRRVGCVRTTGPTCLAFPDGLVVDFTQQCCFRDGQRVKLGPMTWRVLRHYASQPGRYLPHREVIDALWPDAEGGGLEALRSNVNHLRGLLHDEWPFRWLQVQEGFGYRLCPAVAE